MLVPRMRRQRVVPGAYVHAAVAHQPLAHAAVQQLHAVLSFRKQLVPTGQSSHGFAQPHGLHVRQRGWLPRRRQHAQRRRMSLQRLRREQARVRGLLAGQRDVVQQHAERAQQWRGAVARAAQLRRLELLQFGAGPAGSRSCCRLLAQRPADQHEAQRAVQLA